MTRTHFVPIVSGIVALMFPILVVAQLIEPDAPEREVSGCYMVAAEGLDLELVDGFFLPDTLNLTLDTDHNGGVAGPDPGFAIGPGGERTPRVVERWTWRERGFMLRVRPDPFTGFHDFAHWKLDGDSVWVRWKGPFISRELVNEHLIEAEPVDDGFAGVLRFESPTGIQSANVTMTSVGCPDDAYFRTMEREIHRRSRELP